MMRAADNTVIFKFKQYIVKANGTATQVRSGREVLQGTVMDRKSKDQVECWLCDWFCDDEQVITYFEASDSSSTVKTLD